MTTADRTEGESQFERYLSSLGYAYEFEKSYPGRRKRPDYTITAGQIVLADVKDFNPFNPGVGFQQVDVHFRIREKIQAGYKKFKEYKDFPCCVVLHNEGNPHVMITEPAIVLGCMYGTLGFQVPVHVGSGPTPAAEEFPKPQSVFTGDAQMTATKNTTISALLSLRDISVGVLRVRRVRAENKGISYEEALQIASQKFENFDYSEKQPGIIVWENAFAKLPVSRDVFNGPFDMRYGFRDGYIERISCGHGMAQIET
jgi:hypothetical protein